MGNVQSSVFEPGIQIELLSAALILTHSDVHSKPLSVVSVRYVVQSDECWAGTAAYVIFKPLQHFYVIEFSIISHDWHNPMFPA